VLDLASGQAQELAFTAKPARFEEARFSPDGRSVIAITDADSDVRRLAQVELATAPARCSHRLSSGTWKPLS
jgi:hypothetical protein